MNKRAPRAYTASSLIPYGQSEGNLFFNGNLENGWWHPGGVPELQIPLGMDVEFFEGWNEVDPDHHAYVRPEVRTLPRADLPEHEWFLIRDGDYTGHAFKGSGAIMFSIFTKEPIHLPAGKGKLIVPIYPDPVMGYEPNGAKIWSDDPLACMIRPLHVGYPQAWQHTVFGEWNLLTYEWETFVPTADIFGFSARLPFPLPTNGLFFDGISLAFVPSDPEPEPETVYTAAVKVPNGYDKYEVKMVVSNIGSR